VSLLEALSGGRHERYLEDDSAVQYDQVRDEGNAILGHLFGDKQVSREVAMHAAGSTGIGSAILKKMLPVIASMVLGAIFKRMTGGSRQPAPSPRGGSGGGLGDILGDILGGGQSRQTRLDPIPDPGTGGRGGSGGGSLDDLLRDVLGGGQQRAPQPQPRQRAPQQGGGLDDLLRDILGGGAPRQPRPRGGYNDDAVRRSRETIDDILSGDTTTRSGNAADDLLESVRRRTGQ
jgi:hypothetical protein